MRTLYIDIAICVGYIVGITEAACSPHGVTLARQYAVVPSSMNHWVVQTSVLWHACAAVDVFTSHAVLL